MKKVLIMSLTDVSSDPRPLRMIRYFRNISYDIDVFSLKFKQNIEDKINKQIVIPSHKSNFLSKIIRRFNKYTSVLSYLYLPESVKIRFIGNRYNIHKNLSRYKENYDIIVVHDLYILPYVFQICNKAMIIFDAREYYPSQNEEALFFRLFDKNEIIWLCKKYLHQCDRLITVSPGLKNKYESEFGLKFHLLLSTPYYYELLPIKTDKKQIKMVHHGVTNRNRNLEHMIEIVNRLDSRFTLDLYLKITDKKYYDHLVKLVINNDRIKIKKPLKFSEIVTKTNHYDIGLAYIKPATFNIKYALGNKLFEFIQARLALAFGPAPNISEIVNKYQCGIISNEFTIESMVKSLSSLTYETIDEMKMNSDEAAQILCFEKESLKLNKILSSNG